MDDELIFMVCDDRDEMMYKDAPPIQIPPELQIKFDAILTELIEHLGKSSTEEATGAITV